MTGYEAYTLYNALKMHFSSDYDFFKYHGKTKTSVESFENRKDKYYFYKLSRRNSKEDYINFLVSNFLHDSNIWVGTLLLEESLNRYHERMKIIQSISYTFENDLNVLKDKCDDPNNLFKIDDGDYPKLLRMVLQKDVHVETVCILNRVLNFVPVWSKRITDTINWPLFRRKCLKYSPFLDVDDNKMKDIIKKVLL